MPDLSSKLDALRYALLNEYKPEDLKAWACDVLASTPRELLPDWVEILANGNLDAWESVLDVAREDLQADEVGE
jgi:hypothetical protein